ncbi:hypothetical protein WUBG_03345 [Wuchereria bancrofti]|uniref:CSN8/PSMD8/EIF3K domain-containing protein n=1 Tax=Wuchereria bancrofti TaxID=6293 RepID=J9ET54_WUCBA|nr:hypothetical protein WUBG_03345 [Wuchereria bancrofti]
MSEVPDVSEDLNGEQISGCAVVPENGEIRLLSGMCYRPVRHLPKLPANETLYMDTEDSLSTPSFSMYDSTGVSDAPFVAPSVFASKLRSFEQREIQPNERDVDFDFFSHLLIFYMIKEDWLKARQCRLRAEASAANVHLNTLMRICRHLEDGDTGTALHLIKNSHFDDPFKDLIMEVHKRITLSVLRMIEHTYINIEANKLAKMLDTESNNELQKVLIRVGWQLEDAYVIPKMTAQLEHNIKKLDASPYGPIPEIFAKITCGVIGDCIDINKLIQYATFLEINT